MNSIRSPRTILVSDHLIFWITLFVTRCATVYFWRWQQ